MSTTTKERSPRSAAVEAAVEAASESEALSTLCKYAAEAGYKPGWAWHVMEWVRDQRARTAPADGPPEVAPEGDVPLIERHPAATQTTTKGEHCE